MSIAAANQELLDFVRPFGFGSGRCACARERRRIEDLVREHARRNPNPRLEDCFALLQGTWKCLFTDSRYVLGLDKMPGLNLSGVYQRIFVDSSRGEGHYFNVAELSRNGAVKLACGEYAHIHPSPSDPSRVDVRYEYFYFAQRLLTTYEGHEKLGTVLEANCLPGSLRLPFRRPGWQSTLYLDTQLRIVRGNEGGIFILEKIS
jgi:hypothetical protein